MGRRKIKVLIVGLPLFSKKLADNLSKTDPRGKYKSLNTYYSLKDKISSLFYIYSYDILYSINGTLAKSRLVNTALKKNKRVIFHWVGSDVLQAKESIKKNQHIQRYIDEVEHLCEVEWIQKELKEIGINARIINFAGYNTKEKPKPFNEEFNILTYIPENREDFYGIETIKNLASACPEVKINVVGSNHNYPKLKNIDSHGWVDDISKHIDQSVVCLRCTEHDGLSNFVLESMSKGRYVLYNNNMNGIDYFTTENELIDKVKKYHTLFNENKLGINKEAYNVILNDFSEDKIFNDLIDYFNLK